MLRQHAVRSLGRGVCSILWCALNGMPILHAHTRIRSMDLNEILSFKPEKPSLKRVTEDESPALGRDADMRPPRAKIPRGQSQNSHGVEMDMNSVSDEEKLRILQSLEDGDEEEEGEGLDAGGVKRMLLSFEKKVG